VGEDRKDEPQTNQAPNIGVPTDHSELLEELRDRVRYLERRLDEEREARTEERRRHDTLMAQITSRIPQIEAPSQEKPSEAPGSPESGAEGTGGEDVYTDHLHTPSERERPWWRRLFGE
jgi:hypothetical protein